MKKQEFKGTRLEMLMGARLVVASCQANLALFADYKGRYTLPFLNNLLQRVGDVERMPDLQSRGAESERSRADLTVLNRRALDYIQDLKGYIRDAFPEHQRKSMQEAAGTNYILKANKLNWEVTRGMLLAMRLFMTEHQAALWNNGENMPLSFVTKVADLHTEFDTLYQYFLTSRATAVQKTEEKLMACNAVYRAIMDICEDGKRIFRDSDAIRQQFVWDDILMLITGPGVQGLKGYVTDEATTRPIMNAELYVVEKDLFLVTDEEGRFIALQIAAGEYTVKVSAENYVHRTLKMRVNTGRVSSIGVALVRDEELDDSFFEPSAMPS